MQSFANILLLAFLLVVLSQLSESAPFGRGGGAGGNGGRSGPSNGEPNGPGPGTKCRYDFSSQEWTCREGGRDNWCVPGRGFDC
ncbi:hypothetical protein BKA69DRAFT_1071952 [Paraphysoderma sedebokerense]|nr:hypothetical protein BKA69DRAFT_1071952 [Paraphysoderma sedebokerense]